MADLPRDPAVGTYFSCRDLEGLAKDGALELRETGKVEGEPGAVSALDIHDERPDGGRRRRDRGGNRTPALTAVGPLEGRRGPAAPDHRNAGPAVRDEDRP